MDSLDQESLELLYESSFGARISVCQLSGSRRFPSQDSEFYSFWTWDVTVWISQAISLRYESSGSQARLKSAD